MNTTRSSKRVLIILLTLISFITFIFLYLGYFHHKFVLKSIVNEEQKIASKIYSNTFKHLTEHYESIAENLLLNSSVINAFENEDRERLLELTMPIYEKLLKKNKFLHVMHFHTKDTKSFLRLHKPEKFGDDLSSFRHMVKKTNETKLKQTGIEVGIYGISYRVVLPVFNHEGKHLGSFEFGIDINYLFDLFNENYGFESILLLDKDVFKVYANGDNLHFKSFSDKYYSITPNSGVCCSQSEENCVDHLTPDMLVENYSFMEYEDIVNMVFVVTPLENFSQECIGEIVFLKNLNFYTDEIKFIRNLTIGLGLILVLFSFYFLRQVFKNYTHTIHDYQNKIEIKNRTLSKLINIDHLTSTNNRQSIETILKKELSKAKRYERPLSLIMLDIDDFKSINDTHGHNVGDKVLRSFVKTVLCTTRESDHFGRWGGEEFILVATETTREDAVKLAEKIRKNILTSDLLTSQKVTCSIGVTQYLDEEDSDIFVHHADLALYEAKHNGKNRVVVYKASN